MYRKVQGLARNFTLTLPPSLGIFGAQFWAVSSVWESATMALWRSPVRPRYGPLQAKMSPANTHEGGKDNQNRLSFFLLGTIGENSQHIPLR